MMGLMTTGRNANIDNIAMLLTVKPLFLRTINIKQQSTIVMS